MTDVELLWAMLGSGRGWHRWTWHGQDKLEDHYTHVSQRRAFLSVVDRHAYDGDLAVSAVPILNPLEPIWHGQGCALWVRTETGEQARRLERFGVEPTLVLREGDSVRQTAFWALTRPLSVPDVERANRRLAYHLRCVQKHGGAGARVFVPGTVLRTQPNGGRRKRPVMVHVAGGSRDVYRAGVVVKRLKDPPEPKKWWEAA